VTKYKADTSLVMPTYRLICNKCGFDRFMFGKADNECPACTSVDIIVVSGER